jgi:hypothetical protein
MTTEPRPLCFVLMPFGLKQDPGGGPDIDFEAIYELGLKPGIEDAGLEPVRADWERTGGIIHKAMFERIVLCDFAVADLTTANANVFYELGVRHAVRPATTLPVFVAQNRLPFDVNYLRALPYSLAENNRFGPDQGAKLRNAIASRLVELRTLAKNDAATDSPLFQLLTDYGAPDIARLKTDVFRDRVTYSNIARQRLADARRANSAEQVSTVEQELGSLDAVETGVLIDVLLSYRAVSAYDKMLALHERMPMAVQRTVLVREQYAFALNRLKRRGEALGVVQTLIDEHGASSETYGLMGRIYKDQWMEARVSGNRFAAAGLLDRAISAYLRGFEADWRDAYPGINAVTLLDVKGDVASLAKQSELLPVVRYAVMRRLGSSDPDYWDFATLLELSVLSSDPAAAQQALGDALAVIKEPWEATTTANNLTLIRDARVARGSDEAWLTEILAALGEAGAAES